MWETNGEWMHGSTEFVEGQQYVFTVLLKSKDGYEFRRDVADPDLDLKVNGISEGAICDFNDMGNDIIMVQYLFTAKGTTLTGSAADGIKVEVKDLIGSATLMVAQYDGGKMVGVEMQTITGSNTYTMNQLTHKNGCTYRAFLVNSTTYAPLCAANDF